MAPRLDRRWVGAGVAALAVVALWFARATTAHRLEVRAPIAEGLTSGLPVDSLEPSLLTVPVRVDLGPLESAVDGALPRAWGDVDERIAVSGHDRLHVGVAVERGPVSAVFRDSLARVSTTLTYRARAWYNPPLLPEVSTGCALDPSEPAPRLAVTLVSPLSLDRDWRLRSRIRAGVVAPLTDEQRDRCRVTVLNFDVTGRVVSEALGLLERHGTDADRALREVDLRGTFAHWWALVAEPVRLADDVWLALAPEGVAHTRIRGRNRTVETTLVVRARPRVVIGPRPSVPDVPLPPLEPVAEVGPLVVHAEARADYGELSERVEGAVSGRVWSAGRRSVTIRSVRISGVGDGRIALAVALGGDVRGTVYLVGTPSYDPATGQVGIPDLDFDVASRDALVAGAAFLARVGLAEHLRTEARWPTAPAADWAREQVERGFNSRLSDEVRLQGSVSDVTVLGVVADRESLRVRAAVGGEVALIVGDPEV